jgi:hypothetical protein
MSGFELLRRKRIKARVGALVMLALFLFQSITIAATNLSHPRLYFTNDELPGLGKLRNQKLHRHIYKNLMESADWCLTRTPREKWIAPITPDPIYENLYDRFYGIMGDLAITEHLAFAYALSGDQTYGEAAKRWVLASCRVWQREAKGTPDSGKGYAVTRLLKGIAVGYDLVYDRFSEAERQEIRDALVRIGQMYFEKYFQTPAISAKTFRTHHAIVEWSSFGVLSLALLHETPQAQSWLDATVKKFEEHLLPLGLAPDGAQLEGATFWASTMQYRLFFMDALRRVTRRDLFQQFQKQMNADLALASIASEKFSGYDQSHANIALEPYYGQLDYYAPVLLFLAREYRRPVFQYLAQWDHSLGHIQKTRAITPHGEQLLFELGGYAYLWCDESVPVKADEKKLLYHFPSVDEAYLRASWKPNDLLCAVSKGQVVVHAGGRPVLIESAIQEPLTNSQVQSVEDRGDIATIVCGDGQTTNVTVTLNRQQNLITIHRRVADYWLWWGHGAPVRHENELHWGKEVTLKIVRGKITEFDPSGYEPLFATGFNELKLNDPAPMKFPRINAKADDRGQLVVEIKLRR